MFIFYDINLRHNYLRGIMSKKAYVVGVGMTKFMKPSEDNPDYPEMAKTAATRALYDAKLNYN